MITEINKIKDRRPGCFVMKGGKSNIDAYNVATSSADMILKKKFG
jgi:hypothetical protein